MTTKDDFQKNFPFITCIKSNNIEYIGIIINLDSNVASLYDYSTIKSVEDKQAFLDAGETWWWESNRKIPINIFLKNDMAPFKHGIKTFNSKDIEVVFGPVVNLSDIAERRVKRKSIQLVKNVRRVK